MDTKNTRTSESGSVIWFILLAVVLLAALTITVSRSSDSVEQSGDRERARVVASEIMRYAKGLEQAISKMRINGISENEISFQNSFISDYENPYCTNTSCRLFHKEGGGLTYQRPESGWLDGAYSSEDYYGETLFSGNACILNVGNYGESGSCIGTSDQELMMFIPFVRKSICLEINRLADFGIGGEDPPVDTSSAWNATASNARFSGRFNNGTNIDTSPSGGFEKQTTGCFEGDSTPSGGYHFYYTLLARPGG